MFGTALSRFQTCFSALCACTCRPGMTESRVFLISSWTIAEGEQASFGARVWFIMALVSIDFIATRHG